AQCEGGGLRQQVAQETRKRARDILAARHHRENPDGLAPYIGRGCFPPYYPISDRPAEETRWRAIVAACQERGHGGPSCDLFDSQRRLFSENGRAEIRRDVIFIVDIVDSGKPLTCDEMDELIQDLSRHTAAGRGVTTMFEAMEKNGLLSVRY